MNHGIKPRKSLKKLAIVFALAAAGLMQSDTPVDRNDPPELASPPVYSNQSKHSSHTLNGLTQTLIRTDGKKTIISFGRILTNERIERYRNSKDNYYFDLDAKDALTDAIDEILENTLEVAAKDTQITQLLAKEVWDRDDRVNWERRMSDIISKEMDKIKGLDKYRTETNDDDKTTRDENMNTLSSDIENNETAYEFDCEAMSIIEGITIQQAEHALLPHSEDCNIYKAVADYYYVAGTRSDSHSDQMEYGHAYIVSGITGNAIEATSDPSNSHRGPYRESIDPDYTFDHLVNGIPLVTQKGENGVVYGLDMTPRIANYARHLANDAAEAAEREKNEQMNKTRRERHINRGQSLNNKS